MPFVFERHYNGPLRAVIVDWAGTIVDYGSRAPLEAFRATFRNAGVEITVPEAREPMGLAKRDHIGTILRMPRVSAAFHAHYGRDFNDDDVTNLYHAFLPIQQASLLDHSTPIPGAIEALAAFRARGLKVGSTTGYVTELMDRLVPATRDQGLVLDSVVCASDVSDGRPAPYMVWTNLMRLGVPYFAATVKVGDTVADMEEGLCAGLWTVGVSRSGNEVGLSEQEQRALPPGELESLVATAEARLFKAGAHYVVGSIAEVPTLLDQIEARMARGERP